MGETEGALAPALSVSTRPQTTELSADGSGRAMHATVTDIGYCRYFKDRHPLLGQKTVLYLMPVYVHSTITDINMNRLILDL